MTANQDYDYNLSATSLYFLQVAGIPINEINANYPINNNQLHGYHTIYNIVDNNNYQIQVLTSAISTLNSGGKTIRVSQVIDFIDGYPDNNYYKISLKKTFYNVEKIKLISTEFPNTEKVIKSYPLNKQNNLLYWQILKDGTDIYCIAITPGNYTVTTFITEITTQINNVVRPCIDLINTNNTNKLNYYYANNIANINVNPQNNIFTFQILEQVTLSKPLTLSNSVYTDGFNRLRISQQNHNLDIGETITISNAIETNNIPVSYINKTFTIEKILDRDTYEVKLPLYNPTTSVNDITNGGNVVIIVYALKVRLLLDKPNTLGNILGFRQTGNPDSITQYNTTITNASLYEQDFNIDISGSSLNGTINLSGENYILMTCPIIDNIDGIFAKLLLAGDPGSILFNQYIQLGSQLKTKISSLSEFEVSFTDPQGLLYEFNGLEHSYTLEIYENIN